jgi:hypothetical protein
MLTPIKMKRLPQSQKIVIWSGHVSIRTTVKEIRSGIGCSTEFNAATQKALESLEFQRSGSGVADQCSIGLCGTWENIPVQITMIM